jgi:hypothetical protein
LRAFCGRGYPALPALPGLGIHLACDADIERGLRERAVSDPRAAEILLRWMQRPKPLEETAGVDLESMSEAQLERLHAGLVRIAALPPKELQALVESLLADMQDD